MRETDVAYLAGIIDGEGSIMLNKYHKSEYPAPCIAVSSSDLELLEWIKNLIQAGRINKKKNYNPEKHKTSYTYSLYYNRAIEIMELIEPYLVIVRKKKRAQHIVKYYKDVTVRNGRYNAEQKKAKENFYVEFLEI